ncbi:hypothetical protein AURDEDRAFT_172595 [Auricularia subglabra TFB-10046 SS5]|nr:hypothetical protein AURDEDRAFT_172595 [Auricularia subglabra TFB-10046 SS5]
MSSSNNTNNTSSFVREVHPAGQGAFQPTHSGIIETTKVDPLNNKTDQQEWADTKRPAGATTTWTGMATGAAGSAVSTAQSAASMATGAASTAASTGTGLATSAATVATGAAKLAYGTATGNETAKQQGSEQVWGKQ